MLEYPGIMKKILLFVLLVTIFTGTTAFVIFSSGVSDQTGSPGEGTCSSCHGGGGGTTLVSITASPVFVSNQYVPGQTYTITISVINNVFTNFGFDAEILNSSNVTTGTVTSVLAGVKIINSTRQNLTHTTPKSGTGSADFQFVWVAPSGGTATMYAAGNAVDGTGGTGGDSPANSLLILTPAGIGINEMQKSGVSGLNIYPNPVKSEFKISYNLLENAKLKAAIFNLQGKEIAEIANENQSAGTHLLEAQLPADLAKGVYFVRLSAEGKPQVQRLIITQ